MLKRSSLISIVLLSLLLAGCAGTQSRHTDPENDPWEGFNRKVYAFNDGLDKVVRPIAVGYDKIMPDPFQRGVGNFFRNLDAPVTFFSQILQGKFAQSGTTIGRFLLNSTVGLLGFFDVATKAGIPFYNEDLGQTLASWGYEDSRYLVLPFFGPSTFRDGTGRLAGRSAFPRITPPARATARATPTRSRPGPRSTAGSCCGWSALTPGGASGRRRPNGS